MLGYGLHRTVRMDRDATGSLELDVAVQTVSSAPGLQRDPAGVLARGDFPPVRRPAMQALRRVAMSFWIAVMIIVIIALIASLRNHAKK